MIATNATLRPEHIQRKQQIGHEVDYIEHKGSLRVAMAARAPCVVPYCSRSGTPGDDLQSVWVSDGAALRR